MASATELGTQIDGLLGGSFLRNFLVSIDYPNGQLHLQPYVTPPIPDEFRRVGITIGLDATGMNFVVSSVYPNTDAAAQNIKVNDQIVSIDGTALDLRRLRRRRRPAARWNARHVEDAHVRKEDRRSVAGQHERLGSGRRSDPEPLVPGRQSNHHSSRHSSQLRSVFTSIPSFSAARARWPPTWVSAQAA